MRDRQTFCKLRNSTSLQGFQIQLKKVGMAVRKMTLDEIRRHNFTREDALGTPEERQARDHKLQSAMALTNGQHEPVWLHIKLADGQVAEIYSNLVDLEDDYVELHGGFGIPLRAICDVGV